MKIIDLLNKIANGEEVPHKIRTNDREYLYDKYNNWYFYGKTSEDMFIDKDRLNDEVENLDEKAPDKLDLSDYIEITSENDMKYEMFEHIFNKNATIFFTKINEIIDYLEYFKSKGE